ncbi:MAG: hypothetical protein AB1540_01830 [Bdellovibrionota bacterium]
MQKRIGDFLREKGVIDSVQLQEILSFSRKTGLRFGEAGMELGFLSEEKLIELFGPSYKVNFFHLEPGYFPKTTRDFFPIDFIIRHGVLPLGYKTEYSFFLRAQKRLNIGLLTPSHKETITKIEEHAENKLGQKKFAGIRLFLILGDQMIKVLEREYGVTEDELRRKSPAEINPTLAMFLSTG